VSRALPGPAVLRGVSVLLASLAAARLGMSVPDLRRASRATYDAMAGIVIGGARASAGMPAFHDMPIADLEAIRAFVLSAAWQAYNQQKVERR